MGCGDHKPRTSIDHPTLFAVHADGGKTDTKENTVKSHLQVSDILDCLQSVVSYV